MPRKLSILPKNQIRRAADRARGVLTKRAKALANQPDCAIGNGAPQYFSIERAAEILGSDRRAIQSRILAGSIEATSVQAPSSRGKPMWILTRGQLAAAIDALIREYSGSTAPLYVAAVKRLRAVRV